MQYAIVYPPSGKREPLVNSASTSWSNLKGSGLLFLSSNLLEGKQRKQGAEKRKSRRKCLILFSPFLGCIWLIFQHFSDIQLCPQTWGSVKKKNPIHIQHHAGRRTMCGECFSPLFHSKKNNKKKVSDRQVDMKLGKYWWLFDHFISHPLTAFCRQRVCLCFNNSDFLLTLFFPPHLLFSPILIWNLKHHRPPECSLHIKK